MSFPPYAGYLNVCIGIRNPPGLVVPTDNILRSLHYGFLDLIHNRRLHPELVEYFVKQLKDLDPKIKQVQAKWTILNLRSNQVLTILYIILADNSKVAHYLPLFKECCLAMARIAQASEGNDKCLEVVDLFITNILVLANKAIHTGNFLGTMIIELGYNSPDVVYGLYKLGQKHGYLNTMGPVVIGLWHSTAIWKMGELMIEDPDFKIFQVYNKFTYRLDPRKAILPDDDEREEWLPKQYFEYLTTYMSLPIGTLPKDTSFWRDLDPAYYRYP